MDPEFQPNKTSLGDFGDQFKGGVAWVRASNLSGGEAKLFDNVGPKDVLQVFGCTLLSNY